MEYKIRHHGKYIMCLVLGYEGRRQVDSPDFTEPVERFLFNVIDKSDNQIKILSVGRAVGQKIIDLMTAPRPRPRRNWFMRILEWLGIVKPIPVPNEPLALTISMQNGLPNCLPRYEVQRSGG